MSKEVLIKHELKHGWVSLERERLADKTLLHFNVELDTKYPAGVIFEQLILGLTDSEKSWLWPTEYESSPRPPEGGVHENCISYMTYRVPRFDKPEIPAKPVTYSYKLAQYKPQQYLFEYQSIDHPLRGGATVRVVPLSEETSRILWNGAYQQDQEQQIVVNSMVQYIPLLYDRFEELIEAGPCNK